MCTVHHERYDYKLKPVSLSGLVCALSRCVMVINQPPSLTLQSTHTPSPRYCSGVRRRPAAAADHRKQRDRAADEADVVFTDTGVACTLASSPASLIRLLTRMLKLNYPRLFLTISHERCSLFRSRPQSRRTKGHLVYSH